MKRLLLILVAVIMISGISLGQVTVSGSNGADATYATLTNALGAFAAINAADQSGKDIIITITADVTTEAGTNSLNAGLWKSFTINPVGARTVSGTVATAPMINLNGASKVTIDGLNTGGNSLTISNLSTSATALTSTIRLIADASNNIITNCSILGSAAVPLGTNGGNIFISTGTTNGNDNNTISYCKIGPAGTNLPSKGIFANGTTTNANFANSGITINNCEIYDYFLTGGCAGIYALTGNTDWTITNNKIYQTASRTFTAAGIMYGIYFVNATYGNNIQITSNTIGYATNAGTGTFTLLGSVAGAFQGIYLGAQSTAAIACNINSNLISDISMTSSTGTFYGIYNATTASSNTININSNTVRNIATVTTTGIHYGIYSGAATTLSVNGNTLNNITRTGSGALYAIHMMSPTTATFNNNIISNLAINHATSASGIYGIYGNSSSVNVTANGNTIFNLTSTSTGSLTIAGIREYGISGNKVYQNNTIYNLSSGGGTATIYCIYQAAASSPNALDISGNKIYTINGAATIYAFYQSGSSAAVNIYKNKIYDISGFGAAAAVYGIYIGGGTTNNLYNNYVGDLRATAATGLNAINGIYGSATSTYNVYYNTVYLNATSSSATTFGTSCVYFSSTATAFNQRNNILVNLSTPAQEATNVATNGISACLRRSGGTAATVPANYSTTSNNNDFWCKPASGTNNHLSYVEGTSTVTNPKNTIADLKTFMVNRDQASKGENPAFVSTTGSDATFLHISTATPTQLESGAANIATFTDDYEGDIRQGNAGYPVQVNGGGTAPDIGADEFDGMPLDLTPPSIVYTPLPNTASIASRTLVATITDASGVGSGANQPVLYWKINSGAYTGPVAPTSIAGSNYTYDFGLGVVAADVVSYFIVAQDNAATPNVGSFPAGATVTATPPLASAGPAAPSTYTILGTLCGSKTVGVSGDYATLTAAIADLNAKELCGPLTFLLLDASYTNPAETFPLVINRNPGSNATNTVTIKPNTGVTSAITGTLTSGPIFKILTDYFVIDGSNSGGTSRDLTITNSYATTPNVILIGSTGTTPIIKVTVKNCVLINGVNTSTALIISDGTTSGNAGYFSNITIQNNSIQKAYVGVYSIAVVAAGNGSQLITENLMNTSGANAIAFTGVYVQGCDGAVVSKNLIGNFDGTGAQDDKAVWFATGTINSTIEKNYITTLVYSGTGGYGGHGIAVSTGATGSNIMIRNNMISNISGDGWAQSTLGDNSHGIYLYSVQTGVKVYHNSINLYGNTLNKTGAYSYGISLGTGSTAEIIDNIIVNNLGLLSATGLGSIGIFLQTGNTQLEACNYNDIWVNPTGSGVKYIGMIGATGYTDLASWQTASGKDANSVSGDPKFEANTNLHIQPTVISPVSDAGITGYAIDDIDGDVRSNPPDIGADEYTFTPPSVDPPTSFTATPFSSQQIDLTFGLNAASNNVVIVWNLTGTFGTPSGTPPVAGGSFAGGTMLYNGATSPVNHTGLIANTMYYYKVWSFDGSFYSGGLSASATTLAVINPTLFAAIAVAKDEIDLTWVKNLADNNVMVATNSTSTFGTPVQGTAYAATDPITGGGTVIYNGPLSGFNHTGLSTSTQYFYKAFSVDAAKNYSAGVTANATTMCDYATITGTTPGTRCGTGTVELAATASGTLKWFANPTGGTSLFTGSPFTTPPISTTTSFYVSTEASTTGPGTAIIGTGTSSSTSAGYTPYYPYWESSKNQILFLASELTAAGLGAGNINSMALNLSSVSTTAMTNFTVSMGASALTALTTTYETGLTDVYTNASYMPAGTGWQTVTFSTPFAWDGTSNIILQICQGNNTGYSTGSGVYYSTTTFNCHHYGYQDGGTGCAMTTPTYNYVGMYRPNIKFGGLVTATCASPRTGVLATVNAPPALTVRPDTTICNNAVRTLAVVTGGSDFDTYLWGPVTNLFEDEACSIPYTGNSFLTVYYKSTSAGIHSYTCTAHKVIGECINTATSVITNLPASPASTATPPALCISGTSALTIAPATGYGTATFQWQNSSDNSIFTDIADATSLTYSTPVLTSTTYYKMAVKLGAATCSESTVATVTVNDPSITSTTPATRCGSGTVTLGATANIGSTLNWFPSATCGTSLGSGTSFTTPVISTTTPYWVEASTGGTSFNVGLTANTQASGPYGPYGMFFATTKASTISSIDVYPGVATTLIITMNDDLGAVVDSRSFVITAGEVSSTVLKTLPLGFCVPAGVTGWSLNYNVNLYRGSGSYTYPYTNNGFSITGNTYDGNPITSGTRYYYYNWVIYQTCAGPRVQVDATVTPAPAITANAAPLAMCIGGTTLLDASSTNSGYIYTWSPATIPPGGPYVSASPEVTTLYTVTGTDNSGGPYDGCAEIATVTVTVNPSPSSVAATASIYQVCDAVTPYDLYSTSNSNSFVHSTYVSPTKEGGFDQGDTFLSNGWTELNGTYNNWFVGTAAGVKEGLNAAYVGTGFVATGNAAVNHFYRDVVIPAGYTNIALQFYLKMPVIDGGYDYFEVYTTTPAFTPVVGVEPFDNNVNYLLWYYNTSTIFSGYTLHTINLPATLAGTTVRLVFTYLNDGVAPHAVAAVDNISVTAALNIPATYSWTSIPDGFTSSLQNPVGLTQTSTTSYVVTATNSFGCFATDTTTVSTVTSASIVTNPMYVAKCAGETAKFSVVAAGPGLTYQWRKNYTNIPIVDNPSAGTDTLTLLNISSADADIYDVSVLASCGSAVFSDTASLAVHPTPTAVAASNSPVCEGSVLNLTGTTDIGTVFSWSGPAGFTSSVENPSIASATLTAGGTYSFTATLGGCASTGATEVVVNPLPSALAIVPSAPTIIEGAIQALAASGGNVVSTLLSENFNGAEVPGWTAINNSSGGNPALAAWMLYPSDPLNVQSNDNSNYIASNSDAQGSGGTTSTELITPVINTTGYTNLSLSFWHYFKALSDEGKIEVSTDGGVSWLSPALISYTTTQGTATAWAHAVVDLSAYINQTNLQLRFSYNSSWGWYWCVDNVSITTTLASPITWLPITGLYTDALATTPYLGTDAATVYAKPASTTTYTATATSLASCTRTANVIVTVLNKATVTTDATTSVASTTATSGGTVTSDGGSAVTARGVCYGISLNPSLTDNVLTDPGTGTGHYVSNLTLLSPATLYHVRAYATNSAGTSYGADEVFTTLSGTKTINLSVFLEGLYNNGGLMRKAQDEFGDHFPGTVADQITVELHDASNYATVIYNAGLIDLNMDGTATVSIPSTYSGSYYLTIKHRNSIEITSALPVDLSGGVLDYNFATNLSNTYGDNLKAMGEGIYAIYGGDVDQDTGIGVSDMVLVDNQSAEFGVGYIPEDVDGDGGVGVSDMVIVDNNSANFVSAILP